MPSPFKSSKNKKSGGKSKYNNRLVIVCCWAVVVVLFVGGRALVSPASSPSTSPAKSDSPVDGKVKLYASQVDDIQIAGYLPDYRVLGMNLNETLPMLNDLILFSVEIHSRGMVGGCCLQQQHYELVKAAKAAYNPKLKLWITVGGAGRTKHWQQICQDASKRQRFLQSMIRLCAREGIYGIDLDWLAGMATRAEQEMFLKFLKEASKVWHQAGLKISLPLHVNQVFPAWAYQLVDRINLMVYDSPLLPADTIADMSNHVIRLGHTHHALKILLESQCPSHKIWLGIPLYGSRWDDPSATATYKEMVDQLLVDFATTNIVAMKPQLASVSNLADSLEVAFQGYQWDCPKVVREKMSYVYERGLGGVFVWELGQDAVSVDAPGGVMVSAMAVAAKSRDWPVLIRDDCERNDGNNEL